MNLNMCYCIFLIPFAKVQDLENMKGYNHITMNVSLSHS